MKRRNENEAASNSDEEEEQQQPQHEGGGGDMDDEEESARRHKKDKKDKKDRKEKKKQKTSHQDKDAATEEQAQPPAPEKALEKPQAKPPAAQQKPATSTAPSQVPVNTAQGKASGALAKPGAPTGKVAPQQPQQGVKKPVAGGPTPTHSKPVVHRMVNAATIQQQKLLRQRQNPWQTGYESYGKWEKQIGNDAIRSMSWNPIQNTKTQMWEAQIGKNTTLWSIAPPGFRLTRMDYHGIGTLSDLSTEGDAGRKYKSCCVALTRYDPNPASLILGRDPNAKEKEKDQGKVVPDWRNEMDNQIIAAYPEIVDNVTAYIKYLNHEFLMHCVQTLLPHILDEDLLRDTITRKISTMKVEELIDADNTKEIDEILKCIKTMTLTDMKAKAKAGDKKMEATAAIIEELVLEQLRGPIRSWINNGKIPGKFKAKTDIERGYLCLRTNARVFGKKKEDESKDKKGGAADDKKKSAAPSKTAKSTAAAKSLDDALENNGGPASTEGAPEDSTAVNNRPIQVEENDDDDFIPPQQGFFGATREDVNRVCRIMCGRGGGDKGKGYFYRQVHFEYPDKTRIDLSRWPAYLPYAHIGDYASPKFKVTASVSGGTIWLSLSCSDFIFYEVGLHEIKLSPEEIERQNQQLLENQEQEMPFDEGQQPQEEQPAPDPAAPGVNSTTS